MASATSITLFFFLIVIGLILIIFGGDTFVKSVSWIAEKLGVPRFIIGATLVSFVTTLPEIIVSSIAASQGKVDIAIGNAVGSVNANIALIMALSILFIPMAVKRREYVAKFFLLVIAILSLWLIVFTKKELNLYYSLIPIGIFVIFIIENILMTMRQYKKKFCLANTIDVDEYNYVHASKEFKLLANGKIAKLKLKSKTSSKEIITNLFYFFFGVGGIIGGAELLVIFGEKFALGVGVPSRIIAVTIIAVGTSLPELVTTITSIVQKKSDLSIGNVIGANIIDITLILPICAFISGKALPVSTQTLQLDLPFCLATCSLALFPTLISGKFRRWQGGILIAGFVAYLALLSTIFN